MILPHQQNTARIAWLRRFRRELIDAVADIDREDGMLQSNCPGDFDLIEPWVEPKVHDVWINVYKHKYEKGWICFGEDADGYPMATKEDADKCAKEGRIACINVKFPEGEGL